MMAAHSIRSLNPPRLGKLHAEDGPAGFVRIATPAHAGERHVRASEFTIVRTSPARTAVARPCRIVLDPARTLRPVQWLVSITEDFR